MARLAVRGAAMSEPPWWLLSRFFFLIGSVLAVLSSLDGEGFDHVYCAFLMAIVTELYAQEDEGRRK